MDWHPIICREASNLIEAWPEYLCVQPADEGLFLAICKPELLGYIPSEWFDEDGELLPEYRTESGDILLPSQYNGQPVTGHDWEYILGPLGPLDCWTGDPSSRVLQLTPDCVRQALCDIQWDSNNADEVLSALEQFEQKLAAGSKEER